MDKQILTIGYEVPGYSKNEVDFHGEFSLMDSDILLISPDSLYPNGHWLSFTTGGGGCYDIDSSKTYKQRMAFLRKEIEDCLGAGKTVFVFLTKEEGYSLASSVTSPRKNEHTYQTETYSNYSFLPVSMGDSTSASGKHIEFSGNLTFSDFYTKFKESLEYETPTTLRSGFLA